MELLQWLLGWPFLAEGRKMELKVFRDKKFILIMLSSFAWGILAHGMTLFNKYSYHDDAFWVEGFNDIDTYGLGRWGRAVTGIVARMLFGGKHSSTPLFFGVITIAFVALMIYLVCLKLRIDNSLVIISVSGAMICFPAITGMFGFMFVAPYFFFGSFLGVLGAYIYYSGKNIGSFIICTILMAFSTALYQANIPIDLMVLLLFMLDEVFTSDMKWKDYCVLTLKNILICVCFMIEYIISNTIALRVKGMGLSDYKGVSTFGMTTPTDYVIRIITAYKRFIKPIDYVGRQGVSANMFPWSLKYYHMILVAVTLVLLIILVNSLESTRKKCEISLLLVISPLFAYSIYVMVTETEIHGLMTYGEAFMFFLPAYAVSRLRENAKYDNNRLTGILSCISVALIFWIGIVSARYANVCYLKAEVMQAEAINYYDSLIDRIQGTEGYTKETPVLYLGDRSKNDEDFSGEKLFEPIYLPPYHRNSIINDYAWEETMKLWCGFDPVKADQGDLISKDVIKEMPTYPDDGSVKMVDNMLVVKFAD